MAKSRVLLAVAVTVLVGLVSSCTPGATRQSSRRRAGAPVVPRTAVTPRAVGRVVRDSGYAGFVGAQVAISYRGGVVFSRGYGYAVAENRRRPTPSTVFGIGSVTKQFTAAEILRLVQQGRLALDAPARRYLPSTRLPREITVRMLLQHTSGLTGDLTVPGRSTPSGRAAERSVVRKIARTPLTSRPGRVFRYSNNGYYLLGAIAERITHRAYARLVADLVRPAWPRADPGSVTCRSPRPAPAYDPGDPGTPPQRVRTLPYDVTFSAGGLCASAEQLLAWQHALLAGRIVSQHSYRLMTTPSAPSVAANSPYGMGLYVDADPRLVWHDGFLPGADTRSGGYTAYLGYLPGRQIGVAVLANTIGHGDVAREIGQALTTELAQPAS